MQNNHKDAIKLQRHTKNRSKINRNRNKTDDVIPGFVVSV